MRYITVAYNSSGKLDVLHNDNASKQRVLEILKKAVRKLENQLAPTRTSPDPPGKG